MKINDRTENAIRKGENMTRQNTRVTTFTDGSGLPESSSVILHNTEIVRITRRPGPDRDGEATYDVILNTGGWRTVTTKTRMNAALSVFQTPGNPCGISQRDHEWYLTLPDGRGEITMRDDVTKFTITLPTPAEGKFIGGRV